MRGLSEIWSELYIGVHAKCEIWSELYIGVHAKCEIWSEMYVGVHAKCEMWSEMYIGVHAKCEIWSEMYIGVHAKCSLFWADFNETGILSTEFRKILNIKFHENTFLYRCTVHFGIYKVRTQKNAFSIKFDKF